ncbi:MAG: hypothetical protein ACI86H_002502 [bacterium]|jgi:hypothetical protein
MKQQNRYNAELVAGALLPVESRKIATLLLKNGSPQEWKQEIEVNNILQKRSPQTAKRQAILIRKRLETMDHDFLKLVSEANATLLNQCLLVSAIKRSHLLGDFIQQVILEHTRNFQKEITVTHWNYFFENCKNVDSSIESWAVTTQKKVRQVIFKILAESKYIQSTKQKTITLIRIEPELIYYLNRQQENHLIKLLQIN